MTGGGREGRIAEIPPASGAGSRPVDGEDATGGTREGPPGRWGVSGGRGTTGDETRRSLPSFPPRTFLFPGVVTEDPRPPNVRPVGAPVVGVLSVPSFLSRVDVSASTRTTVQGPVPEGLSSSEVRCGRLWSPRRARVHDPPTSTWGHRVVNLVYRWKTYRESFVSPSRLSLDNGGAGEGGRVGVYLVEVPAPTRVPSTLGATSSSSVPVSRLRDTRHTTPVGDSGCLLGPMDGTRCRCDGTVRGGGDGLGRDLGPVPHPRAGRPGGVVGVTRTAPRAWRTGSGPRRRLKCGHRPGAQGCGSSVSRGNKRRRCLRLP